MTRPSILAALLAAVLSLGGTGSFYVTLSDSREAYPLLVSTDSGQPLRWDRGRMAEIQSRSHAVRVSDRGVRFVSAYSGFSDFNSGTFMDTSYWGSLSAPCEPGPGELCTTSGGTVVFPEAASGALIPETVSLLSDPFAVGMASTACKRHSNRVVTDEPVYAVTLCDIAQTGADLVYVDGAIYSRRRSESVVFYVVVSLASVILVTCLAQNMASLISNDKSAPNPFVSIVSCAVVLVFSVVPPLNMAAYITKDDVIYHWFLFAYIAYGLVVWGARLCYSLCSDFEGSGGDAAVPFNVILATLLFALSRLYDGAECHYVAPLLFLLILRVTFKMIASFDLTHLAAGTLDSETLVGTHVNAGDGVSGEAGEQASENAEVREGGTGEKAGEEVLGVAQDETASSDQLLCDSGNVMCSNDCEVKAMHDLRIHHPILATMYQFTIMSDCILAALVHQFAFKPLFFHHHTGDMYTCVIALVAVSMALAVFDSHGWRARFS
jgi:hypothetical protein